MVFSLKIVTLLGAITLFNLMTTYAAQAPSARTTSLSTVLGSKQYYVGVLGKVNWHRAAQLCASRGMSLVSIESAEERKNLRNYLFTNEVLTAQFWTSGNDLALKNEYSWLGSGNKFGYTNWAASYPTNDFNKRCVQINGNFEWTVEDCRTENYFICSKPVVPDCGAYGTCLYTYIPYN